MTFPGLTSRIEGTFWIYSIVGLDLRQHIADPGGDPGAWDGGLVLGGSSPQIVIAGGDGTPQPISPTSLVVSYRAPGAADPQPITLRDRYSGPEVPIPDGDGAAELDFNATWSDGCFAYSGQARIAVTVAAAAAVAACPVDPAGIDSILRSHDDDRLVLGSISRPIGVLSYSARYINDAADDVVGPFSSWDPSAAAISVRAGDSLTLTDDDPDLVLTGAFIRFYRRTASGPEGTVVSGSDLVADAHGAISIPVLRATGRYVLEVPVGWQLPCVSGDGLAYFSVDVR